MLYRNQHLSYFIKLVLVFFTLSSDLTAKTIRFDPSLSEFLLKNALSLQYQMKAKKGLGYKSLVSQIQKYGCGAELLSTPSLLEKIESYEFHKNFLTLLDQCSKNSYSEYEYNEELNKLLEKKEAYLVIAGESLKSPMSYFGHSLIVFLDKDDFYFSPVISILAPTEGLSAIEQIGKGGFSFIKAEMNVIPLHQIIDFYSDKESRDLRFLKLSSNTFDRQKLVDYFNNKLTDQLVYNFFTKNCSTYLYQALDHSCSCFTEASTIITPVKLEKTVLENHKGTVSFSIDSLFNKFNASYEKLTIDEKSLTKKIFLDELSQFPENSTEAGRAAVLASKMSFKTYATPNDAYEKVIKTYGMDHLLLETLPVGSIFEEKELDGLSISSIKGVFSEGSMKIRVSAVDFDLFEQRTKHFVSSKLSAGAFEFSTKNDDTSLESIDLLNIRAITPLNFVTKKPSWSLRIGGERNSNNHFQGILSGGLGASISVRGLVFFALPSFEYTSNFDLPIYSGILFNSEQLSAKYETRNLESHKVSLYRRENNYFGYEYSFLSDDKNAEKHSFTLSYYF
ncbi:DUF4105 domain-containing protein [Marinomonas sp. A79]|uniref:DUF4105 domain-containing protein n=1 Tax=Marinomonas vulgaris TaxID=2823372 RepID=A0ABS5HF95_9GAMM|nr:DUF4105 domain-containing protein [Marinomonas vulgaris]MBR7890285.1 DUF4105 domain-containing protein [Marinomonas vulgaris]